MPFKNARDPKSPMELGNVTIDPVGIISAPSLNADQITVSGVDLMTYIREQLADIPRATIWRHRINPYHIQRIITGNAVIVDRSITLLPGRTYSMTNSTMSIITGTAADYHRKFNMNVRVYLPNRLVRNGGTDTLFDGWSHIMSPMSLIFDTGDQSGPIQARIQITMNGPADLAWRFEPVYQAPEWTLNDMGPNDYQSFSQVSISDIGSSVPVQTTINTDGNFRAEHYMSYNMGRNIQDQAAGLLRQSCYGTVRAGFCAFNNANNRGHTLSTMAQSNVTVNSGTVVIGETDYTGAKPVRWYYTSGGIGHLYYHNASSFGAGAPGKTHITDIPSWGNNQTKSVTLPANVISAINNGTFKGFAVSGEGYQGQYTHHGEMPYRMRLYLKYTITQ